jgi:hypothetical protein
MSDLGDQLKARAGEIGRTAEWTETQALAFSRTLRTYAAEVLRECAREGYDHDTGGLEALADELDGGAK